MPDAPMQPDDSGTPRPGAGLFRAIVTVGGLTMLSRVLGFARDLLIAAVGGAGIVTDAFFVAFQFPNLFRRLFGEGAFSTAFVPIFSRTLASDGHEAAREFAQQALAFMVVILLALAIIMMAGVDVVVRVIAPGFAERPEALALAAHFTVITTPYLLFVCITAMLGGVLNALDRFGAMAAAPVFLNVVLIGAVGLFAIGGLDAAMPTAGHALAWGVAIAGVAQAAWMVWHCERAGMSLRLGLPKLTPLVKRLGVVMLPALGAHGVLQINQIVGTILASTLPVGSVSYLYYADRVNQLPLGVIGVAVATALLPRLSRALRIGDRDEVETSLSRALEIVLLLTLPAATALFVISEPVVTVLFLRGSFDPAAATATADALAAYAFGLVAFVLAKVLSTPFFGREDTRTPFYAAAASLLVYCVAAPLLMIEYAHVGLAAAVTLSGWANVAILTMILGRRGDLTIDARLRRRAPRILIASALMGGVLWFGAPLAHDWLSAGEVERTAALTALIIVGALVYALAARILGAATGSDMRRAFKRSG